MNHKELIQRIDTSWAELQASYEGLSEADMLQGGVTGDWSVKDILGHVTTWEEEILKKMPVLLSGEKPAGYKTPYGGINAFNAQQSSQKHDLPLKVILQQMEDTHKRLLETIEQVPLQAFERETLFRQHLRGDTYGHYPEHTRAILNWRGLP